MALNEPWSIKSRAHVCAVTEQHFTDGESFYTALFPDPESSGYLRKDFSAEGWESRGDNEDKPFSFWGSIYRAPVKEEQVEVTDESPEACRGRQRVGIPTDDIAPGDYLLNAELSAPGGQNWTVSAAHTVPDKPEWWENTLGEADVVLPPYTAITTDAMTVSSRPDPATASAELSRAASRNPARPQKNPLIM